MEKELPQLEPGCDADLDWCERCNAFHMILTAPTERQMVPLLQMASLHFAAFVVANENPEAGAKH